MDQDKLMTLLGTVVGDLGGAYSLPLVRMGEALGLYAALDGAPQNPAALAETTGCAERNVREWLANQAGCGYVTFDPDSGAFSLTEEQTMVFARPDSPVYLIGAFDTAVSGIENQPQVETAFRSGAGIGWSEKSACLACAVAKFFRPGYEGNIVESWLPALDGVVERCRRGAGWPMWAAATASRR